MSISSTVSPCTQNYLFLRLHRLILLPLSTKDKEKVTFPENERFEGTKIQEASQTLRACVGQRLENASE